MRQLIIPFCVEAFLSNGKTSDNKRVPVVSPDYSKVSYTSFLGSSHTPGAFQTASVLKAGAHLHFILPDAFTHAKESGYPQVPNRYVVTRLYADGSKNKIMAKCFMVESDFMSLDARYAGSVTIPKFEETDLRKNWRYLGRSYSLEERLQQDEDAEYLEELTAVGPGDPMFAAYYPSCSSVFGFYDDLHDVPLNTSLTYFVVGYYSNGSKDPFGGVKTLEEFQKLLADMNFSVAQEEVCSGCVLFGEISKIVWKGTQAEYDAEPAGEIRVAAGNTSAEALSAAIVHSMGLSEDMERLLTALQYDLADSGEFADGTYRMDDEIYLRQFQRHEGGEEGLRLAYSVDRQAENGTEPALGSLFSGYCREHEEWSRLKSVLESRRARLFYCWEQYMHCYENPRFVPKDAPPKQEMLQEIMRIATEEIKGLEEEISRQEKKQELCRENLAKEMGECAEVVKTASNPFYAAKDPVLLFSGPGMKRTYAFGEDGRFTTDRTLVCQTGVLKANIALEALMGCLDDVPIWKLLPEGYEEWLYQGILLSDDVRSMIEKTIGKVEISGDTPSEVAKNVYHREPITLFMAWEAEYLPTDTMEEPEKLLKNWEYCAEDTNYRYTGEITPSKLQKEFLSGRTVLTPHAVLHLSESLKRWMQIHPEDAKMMKVAEAVKNLPIVSQNLDGFTKAMLSIKHTFEFPIMGAGGDEAAVLAVRKQVSSERVSILSDGVLHFLRGGLFGIHRLSLIGTFGQTQNVSDSSYFGEKEITFSETMEQVDKRYALMPPAFHQPARLTFRFVSAQNDAVISSSAPETSPVYGIILPELLNGRLMIYEADGTWAGSVSTAYEGDKRVARWVDAKFPERSFAETDIKDRRLKAFVQALLDVDNALSDMLRLMDVYYEKKLIPRTERLIWGRTFVLARCSMQFEFLGEPEFDKSLSAFGTYDTKGVETICFPVMFGDMGRATDGVLGCFDDAYGYEGMCPAFGTNIGRGGRYLLPADQIKLCAKDGEKQLSVMMACHADVSVQTGLMPRQAASLPACHVTAVDDILAAAEMNPVIASPNGVSLPVHEYAWKYREDEKFVRQKIMPPFAGFEETVIMDGFVVKEGKDE